MSVHLLRAVTHLLLAGENIQHTLPTVVEDVEVADVAVVGKIHGHLVSIVVDIIIFVITVGRSLVDWTPPGQDRRLLI